jgi:hypothetical protein
VAPHRIGRAYRCLDLRGIQLDPDLRRFPNAGLFESVFVGTGGGATAGSSHQIGSIGKANETSCYIAISYRAFRLYCEPFFVFPPVSLTDKHHRTKLLNRVAASHVGYYLSDNTNCFTLNLTVERVSTLPASWVSTRNREDKFGNLSRSAGERYLR